MKMKLMLTELMVRRVMAKKDLVNFDHSGV